MRKLYVKILSICLVLILIFSMLFVPNIFAETTKIASSSKIDSRLMEKLSEMDFDDTVKVSVWFEDIDYENVKEKTKERFKSIKSRSSSDATAIKILDSDTNAKFINDFRDDRYVEDVQEIIEIKRNLSANAYAIHNTIVEKRMLDELSLDEDNVMYVSVLAPNIEAILSKEQIYRLVNIDIVECVYATEEGSSIELLEIPTTKATTETSSYSEHMYTMTGVDVLRDQYDLDGANVNVGIFDKGYLERNYISDHYNTTVEVYSYPFDVFYDNHTYNILTLISGFRDNGEMQFEGGIPEANIYVANQNSSHYTSQWKACIEWLMVVKSCNVINMSRCIEDEEQNVYGDNARWIDHIATSHNVHFVMASGNQTQGLDNNYLADSTTAYNAIVVGSAYNDGGLDSDSCFSELQDSAYKPEIIAPGTHVNLPTSNGNTYGTSYAAPIVTCAVAQLCQASAVLRYNAPLMKAVIMSGAERTTLLAREIPLSVVGNTNISLSRECGVGLMNVYNSYMSFVNNGYYQAGTISPYSTLVTKDISVTQTNKLLRVVAAWDKVVTLDGNHSSNDTGSSECDLDLFMLTVTTPSGKKYKSYYPYDNKQVVAFMTTERGTYTISLTRNPAENSDKIIKYGISCSIV